MSGKEMPTCPQTTILRDKKKKKKIDWFDRYKMRTRDSHTSTLGLGVFLRV